MYHPQTKPLCDCYTTLTHPLPPRNKQCKALPFLLPSQNLIHLKGLTGKGLTDIDLQVSPLGGASPVPLRCKYLVFQDSHLLKRRFLGHHS